MKKLKDQILKNMNRKLPVLNLVRIALSFDPPVQNPIVLHNDERKEILFEAYDDLPLSKYKLNLQMDHMLTYLKLGILLTELTKSISIFENQISSRVEWSKADKNSLSKNN